MTALALPVLCSDLYGTSAQVIGIMPNKSIFFLIIFLLYDADILVGVLAVAAIPHQGLIRISTNAAHLVNCLALPSLLFRYTLLILTSLTKLEIKK